MSKKVESIGSRLKKARVKRSLSVDDVYKSTRIHPRIIEALEEDRAEDVLRGSYIKSFLRSYSHFLGLDRDDSMKEFLTVEAPAADETPESGGMPEGAEPPDLSGVRIDIFKAKRFLLPTVLVLCIIFLSYVTGLAGFRLVTRFFKNRPAREKAITSPQEQVPPAVKSRIGFQPIPKNEPLVLKLATLEDVWIQVKSDGKIVFRRVLTKGSIETWNANDSIELWLGKAQAAQLTLNNQTLGSPGKGVIKNILLTREGMKAGKR